MRTIIPFLAGAAAMLLALYLASIPDRCLAATQDNIPCELLLRIWFNP